MTISPDGLHAYLARPDENALSLFSRDAATGQLTFVDEVLGGVNLQGPDVIKLSPDGALAYVATDSGVAVFTRNADTGTLTFQQMLDTGTVEWEDTPAPGRAAGVGLGLLLELRR